MFRVISHRFGLATSRGSIIGATDRYLPGDPWATGATKTATAMGCPIGTNRINGVNGVDDGHDFSLASIVVSPHQTIAAHLRDLVFDASCWRLPTLVKAPLVDTDDVG